MGRAVQPRCRWGLTCSLPILQGQSEPARSASCTRPWGSYTWGQSGGWGTPCAEPVTSTLPTTAPAREEPLWPVQP